MLYKLLTVWWNMYELLQVFGAVKVFVGLELMKWEIYSLELTATRTVRFFDGISPPSRVANHLCVCVCVCMCVCVCVRTCLCLVVTLPSRCAGYHAIQNHSLCLETSLKDPQRFRTSTFNPSQLNCNKSFGVYFLVVRTVYKPVQVSGM